MTKARLTPKVLAEMNGLIENPRTNEAPIDPTTWVMSRCHVSLQCVQRWAAGRNSKGQLPHSKEKPLIEEFVGLFNDLLIKASNEPLKVIRGVMNDDDAKPSERTKAAQWLIERIWPERYGPNVKPLAVNVTMDAPQEQSISDIPQDVFDEMTEAECDELERLQALIEDHKAAAALIVKSARARAVPDEDDGY